MSVIPGKINAQEIQPGVVEVIIRSGRYGQAGEHWRKTLDGPNHNGYGKIYIQRFDAGHRRRDNCSDLSSYYRGCKGANIDECPGAMFIWAGDEEADVEAIDAIDNQALGRDLGNALREFKQTCEADLWEVLFKFI